MNNNNTERNQENLNKNPQGQGGRTEETREGRDTMRGPSPGGESHRNFSAREEIDIEEEDDFDDTEEASLDSADEEDEDEEEAGRGRTDRNEAGPNRSRDANRDQSNRI